MPPPPAMSAANARYDFVDSVDNDMDGLMPTAHSRTTTNARCAEQREERGTSKILAAR